MRCIEDELVAADEAEIISFDAVKVDARKARKLTLVEKWCDPEYQLRQVLRKADATPEQADAEAKATEPKPRIWWHGDVDPNTSRKYLVKNLIPETGKGLFPGQWGTYKTFGALDLACAVMPGGSGEFAGYPVKRPGGVLFIACEGADEIPIRLEAINQTKCGKAERLPFACLEDCPKLLSEDAAKKISARANEVAEEMKKRFGIPLVLIIVDTVIASAGYRKSGEENDAAVSQVIMEVLGEVSRLTGAFAMAVDHFGKVAETGTRGSSAKEAHAEVVLAMLGERELSGAVKNPRLAVRKRRGGHSGVEIPFTVREVEMGEDEDGEPIKTLVIDWRAEAVIQPETKKGGWTKSLRVLQRAMLATALTGKDMRPFGDGPMARVVDMEAVRAEFYKSYPAEGATPAQRQSAKNKAFNRSIKDAQAKALIGVREIDSTTYAWLGNIDPAEAEDLDA
jgi:hypothetical protein